eukprot:m.71231 g.71231  ORF g.71231 m.71231 type:complete len:155 (-) comp12226_c0_seq6:632-1096(-)
MVSPSPSEPGNLQGTLTSKVAWKYKGEIQEQHTKHGHGVQVWGNGMQYEGEYVDGKMHGKGKVSFPNGDYYEGDFEDNIIQGKGKYVYKSGSVFEGDFEAGKYHGQGKFVIKKQPEPGAPADPPPQDIVQEGQFVNGLFVPPEPEGSAKKKKKK